MDSWNRYYSYDIPFFLVRAIAFNFSPVEPHIVHYINFVTDAQHAAKRWQPWSCYKLPFICPFIVHFTSVNSERRIREITSGFWPSTSNEIFLVCGGTRSFFSCFFKIGQFVPFSFAEIIPINIGQDLVHCINVATNDCEDYFFFSLYLWTCIPCCCSLQHLYVYVSVNR